MDRFRDVDHVYPLSVYPDEAFEYTNYVYSCVVCNQNRKREKCGIVITGSTQEVGHYCSADNDLPLGPRALINPRIEDPRHFLELELDTGLLLLVQGLSQLDACRAVYTRDTLALNDPNVARDRRNAARLYMMLMSDIVSALRAGNAGLFEEMLYEILAVGRPTVLATLFEQKDEFHQFRSDVDFFQDAVGLGLNELL